MNREKINNTIDFDLDFAEIEKRKDRVRKIWNYEKVDHIPICLYVFDNKEDFWIYERQKEKEKNLRFDLNNVKKCLKLFRDDYIPYLNPETTMYTVPTILGAKPNYEEGFDNFTTIKDFLIKDVEDIDKIYFPTEKSEIVKMGLMPLNLERINYYKEVTKGAIEMTGFDIESAPVNAANTIETNLFYLSIAAREEKLLEYIRKIADLIIKVQSILISEFGGTDKMTNIDWDYAWYPEGSKANFSDDICSNVGSEAFNTYFKPFHKMICDALGYGGMHNCGPHPNADQYIDYGDNKVKALSISAEYTLDTMDDFLSKMKGGETIIYLLIEQALSDFKQAVDIYKKYIEKAVKQNLVIIPWYTIDAKIHSDSEIKDLYEEFYKVSCEYTRSLDLKG